MTISAKLKNLIYKSVKIEKVITYDIISFRIAGIFSNLY